jgi:hypothetical protein
MSSSEVPRGRSGRCSRAAGGVPPTRLVTRHPARIAKDSWPGRTDGFPMTALDVLDPRLSAPRARLWGRTDP